MSIQFTTSDHLANSFNLYDHRLNQICKSLLPDILDATRFQLSLLLSRSEFDISEPIILDSITGDLHTGLLSTTRILINKRPYYFKPRSPSSHIFWDRTLNILDVKNCQSNIITSNQYAYLEGEVHFINSDESLFDEQNIAYSLGQLYIICYCLGVSDLHIDNFVLCANHVQLIDHETILSLFLIDIIPEIIRYAPDHLYYSENSGEFFHRLENDRLDFPLMSQVFPGVVKSLVSKNCLNAKNLNNVHTAFKQGYMDGLASIDRLKSQIVFDINSDLVNNARLILRATACYERMIKFYHLDCDPSPEFIKYLGLKKLLINAKHSWLDFSQDTRISLIDYEISQIKRMCFPKFTAEYFIDGDDCKIRNKIIELFEQRINQAKQEAFIAHLFNTALVQLKALTR